MRAARVFSARPERAIIALAQLCEERKDDEIVSPDGSNQTSPFIPPRTSPIPSQVTHTVGRSPTKLNVDAIPHIPQFARNLAHQQQTVVKRFPTLPERTPAKLSDRNDPTEASNVIYSAHADGRGRASPLNASQDVSNDASSDTTDIITDDEMMEAFLDSIDDVQSYLDESPELTRASSPATSQQPTSLPPPSLTNDISNCPLPALINDHPPNAPGSRSSDASHTFDHMPFLLIHLEPPQPAHVIPSRIDTVKRASPELASLSALTIPFGYTYCSSSSCAYYHCRPASSLPSHFPDRGDQKQPPPSHNQPPQTVFYETTGPTPFKHSSHVNLFTNNTQAEPGTIYPYYHSTIPFRLQIDRSPQLQKQYEGPVPGPSRQCIFGAGGGSVKNLPQQVLSARKRNSRRGSISDGSSGRTSSKEPSGSTNGNSRSNTPTSSSMTPPLHPRPSSRESSNLSRPPSRTQHSHSNSNTTVKSGAKQHQNGGNGQSVQGHRLRDGSVPSSPVIHQDHSSPFSSPLQQQHQSPSPSASKSTRKDLRHSPLSGVHLYLPLRDSGQLPDPKRDASFNGEASDVACNPRISGSPCASMSNGSATTGSVVDSSPGSISSTSSSLQSAFNRSMTEDSGFEVFSPFQSRIGRLPLSQHGYIIRGGEGKEVTMENVSEGYRITRKNLQKMGVQEGNGRKDLQTFRGRRGEPAGVQLSECGQVRPQSEDSIRRLQQAWREHHTRGAAVDGNDEVYRRPQMETTLKFEARNMLGTGNKQGKK